MRKQELVHLHALCMLVRGHVEAREDVPPGAFEQYDDLGVSPAAVYRGKRVHRRAVLRLAADIASVIEESDSLAERQPTDSGATGDPVEHS